MQEKTLTKIINLIKESYKENKNIKRYIDNRKYKIEISSFYPDIHNHRYVIINEINIKNNIPIKTNVIEIKLDKGILFHIEEDNLINIEDLKVIAKKLNIIDKIILWE